LELLVLDGALAVCRLPPDADVPAECGEFHAVVRTPDEVSLVCSEGNAPDGVDVSGGWRALRVAGTLDHSLTGILSALAGPLARAEIPIFAISTFDTDYVLVPGDRLDAAVTALETAGHTRRR